MARMLGSSSTISILGAIYASAPAIARRPAGTAIEKHAPFGERFSAHDLITDQHWHWGEHNYVRLGPDTEPVHIIHVRRY